MTSSKIMINATQNHHQWIINHPYKHSKGGPSTSMSSKGASTSSHPTNSASTSACSGSKRTSTSSPSTIIYPCQFLNKITYLPLYQLDNYTIPTRELIDWPYFCHQCCAQQRHRYLKRVLSTHPRKRRRIVAKRRVQRTTTLSPRMQKARHHGYQHNPFYWPSYQASLNTTLFKDHYMLVISSFVQPANTFLTPKRQIYVPSAGVC